MSTNPGFATYLAQLSAALDARGMGRALWVLGRGDGFELLTEEGTLKDVFVDVTAPPMPVRLPGPSTFTRELDTRSLTVETTCAAGRSFEVSIAQATAASIATEPPDVLDGEQRAGDRVRLRCYGVGPVHITVR